MSPLPTHARVCTAGLACMLLTSVGCGSAPHAGVAREQAQRAPLRALALEAHAETREGVVVQVSEGDTLRTGDKLWFLVSTNAPAHVYVIQVFPDGAAELLYPPSGDVELHAGDAQRIPTDPRQHFVLDDQPGPEHVVLIGATRPIGESDARLAALVEAVERRRKWPKGVPLEPAVQAATGDPSEAKSAGAPLPPTEGRTDDPHSGPAPSAPPRRRQKRPREPAPAGAKPTGFLELLGPNRSLERGLRLGTEPSKLQVVPDASGVAVSLFRFHHAP